VVWSVTGAIAYAGNVLTSPIFSLLGISVENDTSANTGVGAANGISFHLLNTTMPPLL